MELSREEIKELIAEFAGDADHNARFNHYIDELIRLRGQLRHAEGNNSQLARHRRTDDLGPRMQALTESLRETIARQDLEIAKLKTELATAYRNNHERNLELDALQFVWCNGGCPTGVHRFDQAPEKITQEIVDAAVRNTQRLQSWFINHQHRKQYEKDRNA